MLNATATADDKGKSWKALKANRVKFYDEKWNNCRARERDGERVRERGVYMHYVLYERMLYNFTTRSLYSLWRHCIVVVSIFFPPLALYIFVFCILWLLLPKKNLNSQTLNNAISVLCCLCWCCLPFIESNLVVFKVHRFYIILWNDDAIWEKCHLDGKNC